MFMYNWNRLKGYPHKPKIRTKYKNQQDYLNWLTRLQHTALQLFKWENLPETVDRNLIEWSALWFGKFAFVEDEFGNIISLPTADGGMLSMYGYPITAWAYGFNGINFQFKPFLRGLKLTKGNLEDCNGVICYDNQQRFPYGQFIVETAERISDTMRTIDIARKGFKSPFFIQCSENQYPTVKKILDDIDDNQNAIVTANSFEGLEFNVLNTGVKGEILTALWDNYNNIYDVYKDTFGINNNSQSDKKERLLTGEIEANNDFIKLNAEGRLKEREVFADIANKKWGLNIGVSINDDWRGEDEWRLQMAENGGFGEHPDT